jgi:hypothetical protein
MRIIWLRKAKDVDVVEEDAAGRHRPKPSEEGKVQLDASNLRECWEAYKEEIEKADHIRVFDSEGELVKRIWLIGENEDPHWMERLPEYSEDDEKVAINKAASEEFFEGKIVPLLEKGYKFIVANGAEILTMFDAEGVRL